MSNIDESTFHNEFVSRNLYMVTIFRRLRREIIQQLSRGIIRPSQFVLYWRLLRSERRVEKEMRNMADITYDLEFSSLPSFDRRVFECWILVGRHISWLDQNWVDLDNGTESPEP